MANAGDNGLYQRSGINPYPWNVKEVVLTVSICLIILVIIVAVLHFCTSNRRRQRHGASSPADNTHGVVASSPTGHSPRTTTEPLAPSVMAALPSLAYSNRTDHEPATAVESECAVCLSNVEEGEMVRVLPNCSHMFHVNCIDSWFGSHSTCPVCRLVVAAAPPPQESSTSVGAIRTPADKRSGSPSRAGAPR